MDVDAARDFFRDNHRGVLLTRRADGGPQMSPITAGVDDAGRIVISSRETAYKVRNLRRDPAASVCGFVDGFFGGWVQVDGTADVATLPEAMDELVEYYRRISGEHPDWDDYRAAMERERRVMIRITVARAGPDRAG